MIGEQNLNSMSEFELETSLMSQLIHPNIVRLYGYCFQPSGMVMEVLEGGDLCKQLHDPLSVEGLVFSLIKHVEDTMGIRSLHLLNFERKNVAWILKQREKLAKTAKLKLENRVIAVAQECDASFVGLEPHQALARIDQIFTDNIRCSVEQRLKSLKWDGDLDLTEEDLLPLKPPELPASFESWCGEKAAKWRRCFSQWSQLVERQEQEKRISASQSEQMKSQIVAIESELWAALEQLYLNTCGGREEFQRVKAAQDSLAKIEREQRSVVVPINWSLRLKLAIDIARGVQHLHEIFPPLIHRDLKSPNVFLTRSLVDHPLAREAIFAPSDRQGEQSSHEVVVAKVADFGLSKLLVGGEALKVARGNTQMEHLNAMWAAPEVLAKGAYTTAADVYSFGVVMWELLARQIPFHHVVMQDFIQAKVLEGDRPLLPSFESAIQNVLSDCQDETVDNEKLLFDEYVTLMKQCWDQLPQKRPTMGTVIRSLHQMVQSRLFQQTDLVESEGDEGEDQVNEMSQEWKYHSMETLELDPSSNASSSTSNSSNERRGMKPSCVICPGDIALENQMWIGFENGSVGVCSLSSFSMSSEAASTSLATLIQCDESEKHARCVQAMSYNLAQNQTIWSGSEDGSLFVWNTACILWIPSKKCARFVAGSASCKGCFSLPRDGSCWKEGGWFGTKRRATEWPKAAFAFLKISPCLNSIQRNLN